MKYYTGIGSRKAPKEILAIARDIGEFLAETEWTLRSGGADGMDTAFEEESKRIYTANKEIYYANDCTPEAMQLAARFHPAWSRCSDFARKLHGRNSLQILGPKLDSPSRFVICWTPDGCISHQERSIKTGGTGTAISIADSRGIRVINLQRKDHLDRVLSKIKR